MRKKCITGRKSSLQNFLKKGIKKPIIQSHFLPSLSQSFVLKISPQLKLGGRFDRVDQLKDGSLEIIDYKTGKVPTQKDVDKDQQMTFYCLAASSQGIYQKNPEDILLSFYFFETQEKISTKRTFQDLIKAKKEIIAKAKEIEKSDFLPKPSTLCDFCDYKLLCPAWQ